MAEAEEITNAIKNKKELQSDIEEDEELIKEFLTTEDVVAFVTLVSRIERVRMLCVIFLYRFPVSLRFAADILSATNLIFAVFFIGRFILYLCPSATVNNWLCNREESEDEEHVDEYKDESDVEDDEPRKKKQVIFQESDIEFSDDEEEAKSNIDEEEEEDNDGAAFLRDKKFLRNSKLEMLCRKLDEENFVLTLKLYAATEALNKHNQGIEKCFAEHRVKWDEEKKDLAAKLDESIETLRHCQQEKKDLAAKLDESIETLRNYKHIVNDNHFKDQRRWEKETQTIWYELDADVSNFANAAAANSSSQYDPPSTNDAAAAAIQNAANWEQERNDLTAKLTAANAWYQHYVHAAYDYQLQNHNLLLQQNDLSVRLQSANISAEFYKACLDDSDGECCKLREEINNLTAKLFAEISSAEHYHKLVDEMEEKCRNFQEEKNELLTKLCAAKAASQLYRSYLHDVGSLGV